MTFPFVYAASFDTGDNSQWDSESDTGGLLDFPHYSELYRTPGAPMPYLGAYCMRIDLSGGDTNDHTVTEGDIDIGDGNTGWARFALFVPKDFTATADDIFNIFEFQQAGGTAEAVISLQITASTDNVEIAIADGTEASSGFSSLTKGKWHVIEAKMVADTGSSGTLDLYVDGANVQSLTGLTNAAAVGQGVLGTQNTLATTTGLLYFDEFLFDDARVGILDRFHTHRVIASSSVLFVGPGRIDNVKLLDGGSGDVTLELYDTDQYSASLTPVWVDRTATADVNVDAADVPINFSRGCLAVIGGTLPGATMKIGQATGWGSDGAIRAIAGKRSARAI